MSVLIQMDEIYKENIKTITNRQEMINKIVSEICERNKYLSKDEVMEIQNFCNKKYKDLNFALKTCKGDEELTKEFDRIDTYSDCVKEFVDGKHIKSLPWSLYDEEKLNSMVIDLLETIGFTRADVAVLLEYNQGIYENALINIKEQLHKFMKDGLMDSNPKPSEHYELMVNIYSELTFIHRYASSNDGSKLSKSKMINLGEFRVKFGEIYNRRTMNYVDQISKQHHVKLPEPVDSKPTHIKGA